jgi:hypothetical protein
MKANQPRCFKNVDVNSLLIIWRTHKYALMTWEVFTEWLNIVNKMAAQQNRNILMTVDNCPAYPKAEILSNVEVKFLPLNATSIL